ncbi:NDxxF motif lipoprotein [Bacillus wiedmannii]|uniref:NDxxF motif lipoprotein n=1 Tax=Bacillus thuringiensis TaxID=1428 RepID=A0AAW9JLP9_BACTU|nr:MULTISPECIES: NDxxF motif lipoprotein [Bacillus]MCX3317593.1 NDxxF motif lipoprotein [Bacillus wiedmannii]MDZ5479600.1 NDxxF motif lipoprotein [Bacillus thuringiensis]TKA00649.1 NDxxF motif lipoprotein [Bacillus thuringiensis]
MMRKIFYSAFILFILSACSQKEKENVDTTKDEMPPMQNVEIPSNIFTSEKQNRIIDEEEIKSSIKTYLDSYEELSNASEPFQEIIDEEKKLQGNELEKLGQIYKLLKENDKNFSNYILNNTLPESYQEESKRISQYITALNETLYKLDERLDHFIDDVSNGDLPKKPIIDQVDVVNGREQKKIENFLNKNNIDTKAFGG